MQFLKTLAQILKEVKSKATPYLFFVMIVLIGLFFQAYLHNFNIVYLALFFTFSLAMASCLMGRLNLYGLTISLLSHHRAFSKTPSTLKIVLKNPNSRIRYAISCSNRTDSQQVIRLEGNGTKVISLQTLYEKRGRADMGLVKLFSRFPLPQVSFFKEVEIAHSLTVYPEPKGSSLEEFLSKSSSLTGEQNDFEGLRRYEASDTLSLIYWPSVAKGGEIQSKQFDYVEKMRTLQFDFMTCAQTDELRLSQLCLWVLECEVKRINFAIKMPNQKLESKKLSTDEILEILGRY